MPLEPGTRLGSYEIRKQIGAGGMGDVYRGRDTRLGREIAIKVLPDTLTEDGGRLARFEREAQILASLNHPNIAILHSLEESGKLRFLVMELVDGETFQECIRRGPLAWRQALPLFDQIAGALGAAHELGVIHRDLKPANIMVTSKGVVKILDFGLAKELVATGPGSSFSDSPTVTRGAGTEAGTVLGTAPYMSLEQSRGQAVDERTDIWAFGCCLYEVLGGRAAFLGETIADTLARILEREPDWKALPRDTPDGIARLLRRCLEKEQSKRLRAIADARLEIDAVLTVPEPRAPSIAVLPFLNLSPDPENEYFADGITEDVIAQLAKIRDLKVISRTSVMAFKNREQSLDDIAAKLGVASILEGSVRRAGDRVRIVAQLIDTDTDRHLWAETYDRELTDIFAIQSDVALQITSALEAEISPDEKKRIAKEPTTNLESYQFYLKGMHCLTRYTAEGIQKSHEFFQRAVETDPKSARGHVGMAFVYLILGMGYGSGALSSRDAYSKAKRAAETALEIDPELGDAYAIRGFVQLVFDFDWVGAERAFERAFVLTPGSSLAHDGYGILLSSLGRYDEAITAQKRAQELDPLMVVHSTDLASTYLRAGRYDDAMHVARRVLELQPDFPMGHSTLGWAHMRKEMRDEGVAELERASSLVPDNTLLFAQLGQAYAEAERFDDARKALEKLEALSKKRYVPPYHMAYVYTGLGESDKAMDALEAAYEERAGGVYGIKGSFLFTELREHPRFKALLAKMNLSEPSNE